MRLLGITDLHGNSTSLQRILAAGADAVDMILFGGDITHFGSPRQAESFLRRAQDTGTEVLAVAGNCDSAEIDRRLIEMGISLAGCGVVCEGVALQGLAAMPPWRRRMYQCTEEELAEALRAGYVQLGGARPHVVLSHAPPRNGKLDRTALLRHVGSTALRDFIAATQPSLVICGHIHEARGIERRGPTTVVNCGAARAGYYAVAEVGEEVNVELRRV